MLSRIYSSLKYRMNLAKYGIYHLSQKNFNISSLKIRNKRINVAFPKDEKSILEYELHSILIDDCYGLNTFKGEIKTVLDIGANIGLFSIASSYYFPQATIHAYEPNFNLKYYLDHNCKSVGANYFLEAIGHQNGFVNLNLGSNSLHSITSSDSPGKINCTSFNEAIQKLGEIIDFVKLDCEGAEWQLFKDKETWSKVRYLTMEYHLWAEPGYSFNDLFRCLDEIGFNCTIHKPSPSGKWGLLQAYNKLLVA